MKLGFSYKFLLLTFDRCFSIYCLNYLGNFGIKTSQEGYFGKDPVAQEILVQPQKYKKDIMVKTVTDLKRTGLSLERSQANP